MSESTPSLRRIDQSAWVGREAAASRAGLAAVRRTAGATRRLPSTMRGLSTHHALSPLLPAPAALHRLVAALGGRLAVVDHAPTTVLPRPALALVRGLAEGAMVGVSAPAAAVRPPPPWPVDSRRAYEQALVRAWCAAAPDGAGRVHHRLLGGGARWVAVAFYEQEPATVVRIAGADGSGDTLPLPDFAAEFGYRVVVCTGRGTAPPDWAAVDAAAGRGTATAAGAPQPWFAGPVLAPDSWVVPRMAPAVRAEWAALTGRTSRQDAYWFPESWARFLEPGRVVGCVSARDVARSRTGRVPGAPDAAPAGPDATPWDDAFSHAEPRYGAPSPRLERGVCVPPGYCRLDCRGVLTVAVHHA